MAIQRTCSVKGCERHAHGRGYCLPHYKRWRRHGDPMLGQTRAKAGEPEEYLRAVVLNWAQPGCLIWPYCRSGNGYAAIQMGGSLRSVSRLVCELALGPAPAPTFQAAHSCGRGHEGCVNKAHLSWKSASDNKADMVEHGTAQVGRRNGRTKLTETAVRHIRNSAGAVSNKDLAARYQITSGYVRQVQKLKTWRWLA